MIMRTGLILTELRFCRTYDSGEQEIELCCRWRQKKLRRLSTLGYHGYTLHSKASMLATRGDWQIRALLASVGRN
jgi:hypothetical protein